MNKVISREYVEKNYIHKEKVKKDNRRTSKNYKRREREILLSRKCNWRYIKRHFRTNNGGNKRCQ